MQAPVEDEVLTPTMNGALPRTEQEALPPRVEQILADQEKRVRRAISAFGIFAVTALIIALANLLAVALKLDAKRTTTVRVAAAPAAATPAAAAPAAAAPSKLGVTLKEFKVLPSSTRASAGRVTFNVHNTGKATHEFVVIRTNKPAGALLKGSRADESGNVGETGDLAPGDVKSLTLKLAAGHYALICNLPGHYQAGQYANFTVVR